MLYAVKYKGTKLGLSVNEETDTDEWCASSSELTQFTSLAHVNEVCKKYGVALSLCEIIPHPNQTPRGIKLRHVAPPRFKS